MTHCPVPPEKICKGCFREIVNPFKAHGGQAFHDLTCMLKWMKRYGDKIIAREVKA